MNKEQIVGRLLSEGLISGEEAIVLLKKDPFFDNSFVPVHHITIEPTVDFGGEDSSSPRTYGDICPCNPDNGGSGICNCILGNKLLEQPEYPLNYSIYRRCNNILNRKLEGWTLVPHYIS